MGRRITFRRLRADTTQSAGQGSVRHYAIGDVHGRQDLLKTLLDRILEDAAAQTDGLDTKLIFLGDYIDRGDDSAHVVETLSKLEVDAGWELVFLKGNHEEALIDFLDDPIAGQSWLRYGAAQTIASYGVPQPPKRPAESDLFRLRDGLASAIGGHRQFLDGLRTFVQDGRLLFTHAGCNASAPNPLGDLDAMVWGHPSGLVDQPIEGHVVVHGHFDGAEPVRRDGRICIDTGAYYSGTLTAVRLDAKTTFIAT